MMLTSLYITIKKREELFPSNLMLHTGIYWHAVRLPLNRVTLEDHFSKCHTNHLMKFVYYVLYAQHSSLLSKQYN